MRTFIEAIFTLPPTASGAAVRVWPNLTGSGSLAVSWSVGWRRHVSKRHSRTNGCSRVTGAPTRIWGSWVSHGNGVPLAVVRKFAVAPSSRVTARAALSSLTAWTAAASCGSATSVGVNSGLVPAASPISPYWLSA